MKIKKGDQVHIVSGKDRGKDGKVLRVIPDRAKIIVEGVNAQTRHQRSRREGKKGEKVRKFMPIDISNVMVVCLSCKQPARIGYKISESGKKFRICKKCKAEL